MELVQTLPASWYRDAAYFERERAPIFASSWMHVAYDFELPGPGSYITENLAGWPIFIRRDDSGALRAFYNLCPHRAGPIVWEGQGHAANMVCRYHGWAFGTDGALLSARDFGCPAPADMDLTPIQVESWRGLIFVCLRRDVPSLAESLGEIPQQLAELPFEGYTFHSRSVRHLACNWKTYADNFLEGYHVPTVHPAMSRDADSSNYEVIIGRDPRWNTHVMPQRNSSTFGVFGWFWPTFAYDILPGGFAVERWLPRGQTHTDLIFEYFFADDAPEVEHTVRFSEEVADEDAKVCEHVQRNLDAGNYVTGVLSPKWEYPLESFHRMVREAIGEPAPAAAPRRG